MLSFVNLKPGITQLILYQFQSTEPYPYSYLLASVHILHIQDVPHANSGVNAEKNRGSEITNTHTYNKEM